MRWIALGALVVVTGVAAADDDPAVSAARAAEQLGKAGNFVGAAAKFREAYKLDPRPQFLCNIGVAYFNAKDHPRAQLYLGECLQRANALEATLVKRLRTLVTSAEAALRAGDFAPLDVVVQPTSANIGLDSLSPDETFLGSRVVWVPFGARTVTVSADGHVTQQREVQVKSRGPRQVKVTLERASRPDPTPADSKPPTTGSPDAKPETPGPETPPARASVRSRSRVPAIVTSVTSGALAVAGVFTYLRARSIMADAADELDRPTYDATVDRARTWERGAWALAGAAGLAAVTSVYLWRRTSVRVEVTPAGTSAVSIAGSW